MRQVPGKAGEAQTEPDLEFPREQPQGLLTYQALLFMSCLYSPPTPILLFLFRVSCSPGYVTPDVAKDDFDLTGFCLQHQMLEL